MRISRDLFISRAVWEAHKDPGLRFDIDIDPGELIQWGNVLLSESRGYWHGLSGRLADRLGVSAAAWNVVVRIHRPDDPESMGDSVLDLAPYILARSGILQSDCGVMKSASIELCERYFELGKRSGNHTTTW